MDISVDGRNEYTKLILSYIGREEIDHEFYGVSV